MRTAYSTLVYNRNLQVVDGPFNNHSFSSMFDRIDHFCSDMGSFDFHVLFFANFLSTFCTRPVLLMFSRQNLVSSPDFAQPFTNTLDEMFMRKGFLALFIQFLLSRESWGNTVCKTVESAIWPDLEFADHI